MKSQKQIFKFFGLFLIVYIGLMIVLSVTGISGLYTKAFSAYGTGWYNTFGNKEILFQFQPAPTAEKTEIDLNIYFVNHKLLAEVAEEARQKGETTYTARRASWGINTWLFGFLPTLFMVSLILVSPISWKRKGIAILIGFIILHIYFTLRLHFEFTDQIALHDWLSSRKLSGAYQSFSKFVHRFLYIEFNYVLAFLVWIAVTFRKADFDGWMEAIKEKG